MNRLQKKCIIVTAGVHLLLLLILIVGPAFFSPRPKADDLQVLEVIPANLIDAPFSSGVANAQPPPPEPVTPPAPRPPAPVVTPPAPVAPPVEPPKSIIKEIEKALTPPEKPKETHKPVISTTLVTRTTPKTSPDASKANDAARARAIRKALQKLKNNLTSATTVDMPGNSSVSYASYASAVRSVYDEAWTLPDRIANEEEVTKASVTIASDGTVISASIVTPSGDANVDASVQRALERVKFVAPFPEGATEKERTYTINFNPKTKQMLE
jgi:TonB family protein